jgi:hypothetical protein
VKWVALPQVVGVIPNLRCFGRSSNVAGLGHAHPATPVSFLDQFPDAWDDLAAIQFDVGHERFVG